MLRTVFALVLLAFAQASRVEVREGFEAQARLGASCDDLQSRFHDRVTAIHASLQAVDEQSDEQSDVSTAARPRLAMRMYGIIRTLRRARECSWVIENNSEDLDQMRGVVHKLLAANPCAEVARLEMESGRSNGDMESITRAMSILMSDDCEALEMPEGANTELTPEEQLQEAEDEIQDRFDELDTNVEGSAFIEAHKSQGFRSFMRGVGVLFLMLFLLLACTYVAAVVATILGFAVALLVSTVWSGAFRYSSRYGSIMHNAGLAGLALGFPSCAYQLYNTLLPRLTQ